MDFERAALRHLDRYPASTAGLRAVLERRAERSRAHHGGDPAEAEPLIAATLSLMHERGFLDDRLYGLALARRLRARGGSLRRIAVRLHEKGIPAGLRSEVLEETGGDEAELEAARIYARRRRLGVHRRTSPSYSLARNEPEQEEAEDQNHRHADEQQHRDQHHHQRHQRQRQRQRDLAALARAGFSFALATRALDGD